VTEEQTMTGWVRRRREELADDPEYVAEGLALRLMEQIVRRMDEEGLSPAELADKLGVSRAYVSKFLNAPPNLTLRSLAAVALALGARPQVSLVYALSPSGGHRSTESSLVIETVAPQPESAPALRDDAGQVGPLGASKPAMVMALAV